MNLFVYGTLLSSVPSSMSKFLRRRATLIGTATVIGALHDLGMYPGFTVGGPTNVRGELYELNEGKADQTLEMLDAYEGVTGEKEDEYARQIIECKLPDGRTVSAQTYLSIKIPPNVKSIPNGDYAKFYKSNSAHQRFVNGG